jgi:putative ABC transport system permease protein
MILLQLAWRSLLNRRSTVILAILTIAVSVLLLLGVDKLRGDARRSFFSTISGVDLVVGPRTGAIQLLLYSVFHVGDATNNIRWSSFEQIRSMPTVAWAVPLSLGDSHAGNRVIGTTAEFFQRYKYGDKRSLQFASGAPFTHLFDAVVGAEVARTLSYQTGSPLVVTHGMGRANLHTHEQLPFKVVGVLAPTGTPVDRSVLVSLEAISAIHVGWESGRPRGALQVEAQAMEQQDLTPSTITAALLGLKNRAASFHVQRLINDSQTEPLMAILPGSTLQQLWGLVGVAEGALLVISGCVVVAGLLGMLAIMLATLEQRRREMALLRSVGARPWHIFALLLLECALLAALGIALGVLLLAAVCTLAAPWLAASQGIQLSAILLSPLAYKLLGLVLLSALLLGLIPATAAYRRSLSDGLSIRL